MRMIIIGMRSTYPKDSVTYLKTLLGKTPSGQYIWIGCHFNEIFDIRLGSLEVLGGITILGHLTSKGEFDPFWHDICYLIINEFSMISRSSLATICHKTSPLVLKAPPMPLKAIRLGG